ncbi:2-phospho-L-lactate guanylyltransferase [Tomitella biformata]|uniref:2-phospho-L-lactate guanylyltransferase n=1 Tax=Tomitella biformata TaxID=630403 RepID=UPI000467C4F8|nr:2-phospho-L-lactate guanylyltransferase [Tomitella biformata]
MSTRASADSGVHVLIPVKHLARAKSRLAPRLEAVERKLLALAMLEDTLRAATASPLVGSITVVTPDESAARRAHACGVAVLAEEALPAVAPALGPLNAALDAAARQVRANSTPSSLMVLQADLPALRPEELTAAIAQAAGRRALVADYSGIGTTTLIVPGPRAELTPRFGPWSAREHERGGAVPLVGDWPGLRSDVDTPGDLRRVHRLGVGPATTALLAALDDSDWNTA